jgi:hypothetical protein
MEATPRGESKEERGMEATHGGEGTEAEAAHGGEDTEAEAAVERETGSKDLGFEDAWTRLGLLML